MTDETQEPDFSIFPTQTDRDLLITRLRLLGIKQVKVSFQGGGDSGEVESVDAETGDGKPIDLEAETIDGWENQSSYIQGGGWKRELKRSRMTLAQLLTNLTYDALQQSEHDWYNNDGGQGELTIDFTQSPPEIRIDIQINYTSTEDYEYKL